MKKTVKSLLGSLAYRFGAHRGVFRNRGVIIAFHRVSDYPAGEALNCRVDVFEGLCRFFRKHFDVVPLQELLRRVQQGSALDGALSITFDDGYRDNFHTAAPILQSLGLPATFFVATNFIDSRIVPEWDRNDGFPAEWMTWDEVRELAGMGFDIGGHTMNHADLGTVGTDVAQTEIAGCRQALLEKLGLSVPHFAYPFGGIANVTADTARIVESEGFECCLSCHGGLVERGDGVFSLQREPINAWVESAYQYGFELYLKARSAGA